MRNTLKALLAWFLATVIFLGQLPTAAQAQSGGLALVRDAEIEHIIRVYATPLFLAAGLDPNSITVYLVNDPTLNAFVAGGQNLFLNTGLLMAAEDPLEVIGVIAHETGHMSGGHYAQRVAAMDNANLEMLAAYVLGIVGAIASGRGEVANAAILAGQDMILRSLLAFTRGQEQSADQAAVTFLAATGQSPEGMLRFMERLEGQQVLLSSHQDPYLLTHPLTQERIDFMEQAVRESPNVGKPAPPELQAMQDRMRAKLIGFVESSRNVLAAYPESDLSVPARYARAIMYYRIPDMPKALSEVDQLLAMTPDDPYFIELKAQMLFENGRLEEALPLYRRTVELLPDEMQMRQMLARTLIEMPSEANDRAALEELKLVLVAEPNNAFAWRLAATAYGRLGDDGMTALALAEAALATGDNQGAYENAKRAQQFLAPNTPGWLRADDVMNEAERRAQQ